MWNFMSMFTFFFQLIIKLTQQLKMKLYTTFNVAYFDTEISIHLIVETNKQQIAAKSRFI